MVHVLPTHPQVARGGQEPDGAVVETRNLHAGYGPLHVLRGIDLSIASCRITAVIGPSGCGKSTFLRCLNRMHELVPGARITGQVLLRGADVYAPGVDPVGIRRRIGMVFQRPNPFPTMSILDNVVAGLRLVGIRDRRHLVEVAERALRQAALWDEVKDRLQKPATALSGGQQQRLCIARALAVEPEVLLLDEPCSSLDPLSTARIEDLLRSLAHHITVVLVTHNMQQAARVSDFTAFLLDGELVEHGPTDRVFTRPRDRRTEDYITGRFG
jgi:phosphate transport system ATP-binding protein